MGILNNRYHRSDQRQHQSRHRNNFNLPGGAHGTLITDPFSLGSCKTTDKPVVYFNYLLGTEEAEYADNGQMRDSARVYVSTDGVIGNDCHEQLGSGRSDHLARRWQVATFLSDSVTALSPIPASRSRAVWPAWRQARVDLSRYAGQEDLRLRFDFHTAGDTDEGLFEDVFGNFNSNERGQRNNFEGFFIDDIVVGLTERGEMVTGAIINESFVETDEPISHIPGIPVPQVVPAGLSLEIRRGQSTELISILFAPTSALSIPSTRTNG
jgi:hypothetical protein